MSRNLWHVTAREVYRGASFSLEHTRNSLLEHAGSYEKESGK
jgi:hypothetical protein